MKPEEYMETVYGERHSEEFRKKENCGPFPGWNMDRCQTCEAWKIYDMIRERCASMEGVVRAARLIIPTSSAAPNPDKVFDLREALSAFDATPKK